MLCLTSLNNDFAQFHTPRLEDFLSPNLEGDGEYDIVCLSHLRWNFVFQRPQHLLTR